MVNELHIRNYKSIKALDISPKRLNVFIGEHNSGKSNILEALSWFSVNALSKDVVPELFRFKSPTDLFYDSDASKVIEVNTDELCLSIEFAKNTNGAPLNHFEGIIFESDVDKSYPNWKNVQDSTTRFNLSIKGEVESSLTMPFPTSFRTYTFKRLRHFQNSYTPYLNPPFGDNIPALLLSNKEYKELVSNLFKEKGFRLMLKPAEGDINMAKDVHDELYAYPYLSISETLQRIVFYLLAIKTNQQAILILDEPESNTFPLYTKQLAELIANDNANQYFIATHNPYLLDSLVSKTPEKDLAVFVTRMKDYQTTVTPVTTKNISRLLDMGADVYFNLDKLADAND